jgi:hypothetical protein
MVIRRLESRSLFALALIVASGCQCGSEKLIDSRARLDVKPTMLDFGNVVKGDLRVLGLDVSNLGSVALEITMSAFAPAGGEFAFASPVPTKLDAGQKVNLSIAFQPTQLGEADATLTFQATDGKPQIVVMLRGVGVEGGVVVSSDGDKCNGMDPSISFGNVNPMMTVERHITVKSTGMSPVNILSAVVDPGTTSEFSIDGSGLPKSLAPGDQLMLVARYTPVDGGPDMGTFVITTDSPATPSIKIPVCGAGIAPALCAHPVPLDLGNVSDGRSASGTMTLESCGLQPLALNSVMLSADAQHPTNAGFHLGAVAGLPMTLAPGMTIDVAVSFDAHPPYGDAKGFVAAQSSALGSPQSFFPIKAKVAMPCTLFAAPMSVSFRNVAAGQSQTQMVLVGNSGDIDCSVTMLTVTSSDASNPFSLSMPPQTPFMVSSGQSQLLKVAYAAPDSGQHDGKLAIVDASGMTQDIALHGNPGAVTGCAIDAQPSVVNFGVTAIGSTVHQGINAVDVGDAPCRITAARLVHPDPVFTVTPPLVAIAFPMVGPAAIDVTYSPTDAVASSNVVEIDYAPLTGGTGGSVLVGLNASAGDAKICVMPTSLNFGTVSAGSTAMQSIVISSCGSVELHLRGVMKSGSSAFQISQTPTLPETLAAGQSTMPSLGITYAPTGPGPDFGQIDILSNDHQTPVVHVPLSGNFAGNCAQVLDCTPTSIAFGTTDVGTTKVVRVVCRSLGTAPVTVSSASLSGGGSDLTVIAQTPATIPPGDAWTFDVRYAPTTPSSASAMLMIASNACMSPQPAMIAGMGVMPQLPQCLPPSTFQPTQKWAWHGSSIESGSKNVWSTPLVANLNDDNGDGRIDENDIPDVVFISMDHYLISDPNASVPATLRVVRGDNGMEEFSVTNPHFADTSLLAIGDIDGDGVPEIIGSKWVQTPPGMGMGNFYGRYVTGNLVALDNTGRLKWESDPWSWPVDALWNASGPAIADLDGDGFAEIIFGKDVYDHTGHILWRGTGQAGFAGASPHSIVADIDLDGHPEVIAGGTVYKADGTILWTAAGIMEGGTAVGMFDPNDTFPEIAIFSGGTVSVFDHLGQKKWSDPISSMGPTTQLPIVADFDGDRTPDIAVGDGEAVHVYKGQGGLAWTMPVMDMTCCVGLSAFDFEGDGVYELILHDYGRVYVFRGTDGTEIYNAPRPSETAYEMPVVADVDNNGRAELVVATMDIGGNGGGIIAYSNVGDSWVRAPRIFNQQSYHVSNVYESGAIPRVETPLPQAPRVFRGTVPSCR